MSDKIAIIYWSGTGNTEAMAKSVQKGVENAGASAELFSVSGFSGNIDDYSKLALGCPAMGSENLEESEFQPFGQKSSLIRFLRLGRRRMDENLAGGCFFGGSFFG